MSLLSRNLLCTLLIQLVFMFRYSVAQASEVPLGSKPSADDVLFDAQANYRQKFNQKNYTFNFQDPNIPGVNRAPGGVVIPFNIVTDKALFGTNVGGALLEFGPCGINTPHIHPRSTEIAHVIEGNITFGIVEENGKQSRVIIKHVTEGQSIFLPQGYIHYQHNLNDRPAKFVAAFSNPDAGTLTIAKAFFKLPPQTTAAALGISLQEAQRLTTSVNQTKNFEQGPDGARGCLGKGPTQTFFTAEEAPIDTNSLKYPSGGDDTGYPYYQNGGGDNLGSSGGSRSSAPVPAPAPEPTRGSGSGGGSQGMGGSNQGMGGSNQGSGGGSNQGSGGGSSQGSGVGSSFGAPSGGSRGTKRSLFQHLL